MLEYAPKGLVGVLTPQANTTVEAEFSILKPPSIGLITSRLMVIRYHPLIPMATSTSHPTALVM